MGSMSTYIVLGQGFYDGYAGYVCPSNYMKVIADRLVELDFDELYRSRLSCNSMLHLL